MTRPSYRLLSLRYKEYKYLFRRKEMSLSRTNSLPPMDFLRVEEDKEVEALKGHSLLAPLTPQFESMTTLKRAEKLLSSSSLWQKSKQLDSLTVLPKPPQFSMLHAAAITGDRAGLQTLLAGKFCNIDIRDKVRSRFPCVRRTPASPLSPGSGSVHKNKF